MVLRMTKKSKGASVPDLLERGHVKGQDPSTPRKEKSARQEADAELDAALEHTFPASDPISFESTLVPGGHR
jgi:hypothetical protein